MPYKNKKFVTSALYNATYMSGMAGGYAAFIGFGDVKMALAGVVAGGFAGFSGHKTLQHFKSASQKPEQPEPQPCLIPDPY